MGGLLSVPNLDKETACESTDYVAYGCASHQGWRINMEDAHALIPALDGSERAVPRSFFAVYDGHGGSLVAKYCASYLHRTLQTSAQYKNNHLEAGLMRAYINTDKDLLTETGKKRLQELASVSTQMKDKKDKVDAENQGCTAVSILLDFEEKVLYCANTGDSRAIIVREGVCTPLSEDHKPLMEKELKRIEDAGGYVKNGRVNGNLNLSRTIGDLTYKHDYTLEPGEQVISCVPDIVIEKLEPNIDFFVLACDGIWDVFSNENVAEFVRIMLFPSSELSEEQRKKYYDLRSPDDATEKEKQAVKKLDEALCEPWPGDVATSLEELLKLASIRLINSCVSRRSSPFSVGCDNMTAVIVMIQDSEFTKKVIASLKSRAN